MQMMASVSQFLGDSIEKDMIRKIAEAHGGKVLDSKDTITQLLNDGSEPINGIDVRPRMLAAILKFADELADDSHRANRVLQSIDAIPKSSMIFHKYASCLHSVMLRDHCKSVELSYCVNIDEMKSKFAKLNSKTNRFVQVYILDEILLRLHKMYQERSYCNRFMAPVVHVHSLVVKIKTSKANEQIGDDLPEIRFRLEELGYPDELPGGIYALSSDLRDWSGRDKKLTGEVFSRTLIKQDEETS